jgi:hypothetical protein
MLQRIIFGEDEDEAGMLQHLRVSQDMLLGPLIFFFSPFIRLLFKQHFSMKCR